MQDFCETYLVKGEKRVWSRPWNFVPNATITPRMFELQPAVEWPMTPYEVGCPYAIRGFDYDYVGILWLDDLRWRLGKWEINPAAVHERGIAHLARQARNEKNPDGMMTRELLKRTQQAYRILFSRALRGIYVWIPDGEYRIIR